MNDQNFKDLFLTVFYFCKILKIREKISGNLQFFLYTVPSEDAHR